MNTTAELYKHNPRPLAPLPVSMLCRLCPHRHTCRAHAQGATGCGITTQGRPPQ